MRIQSIVFAGALLALICGDALAQGAAIPAPSAEDVAKRAEALTQDQIKQSKDTAGLSKLAQLYESKGDLDRLTWTLQRLIEMMPNSGLLKLQLALVYAKQDKKTEAYDILIKLQTQGFDFDISKDARFEKIHGTKVWDYIVANLHANSKQFGEGKVAFSIPKGDRLIESIGYDPKRKQFLLGSQREGKVYLADETGKLKDFITASPENGMWSVVALAVDSAHDRLYVASAGVPYFKHFSAESFGKSGVFEYELSSGKFVQKYLVGQGMLSGITVGKDGRVYAADSTARRIYKLDGGALKLLFDDNKLTSIHGLAVSDDNKSLYFADYALGLFGIDLTNGKPFALRHNPERLVVGGVDGMNYYDGNLIIIESGMTPQRVMRLQLMPDGRGIAGAMPLDVAQPAFEGPTVGTLVGDNLYFLVSSEKDLYDSNGVLTDADKLSPVEVFRSNARFAWGQKGVGSGLSAVPTKQQGPIMEQIKNAPAKPGAKTAPPKKDQPASGTDKS